MSGIAATLHNGSLLWFSPPRPFATANLKEVHLGTYSLRLTVSRKSWRSRRGGRGQG